MSTIIQESTIISPSIKTPRRNTASISTSSVQKPKNRFSRNYHPSRADLINAESYLGSQIFGPIPAGHRREFFHDRENIWIWHEEWTDQAQQFRRLTVRYEVRTTGVFKKISAGSYFRLEGDELANFRRAAHAYLRVVKTNLYNLPAAQN